MVVYYKEKLRYNKKWKTWIPHRKRLYLYWYKFLVLAEQSPDYKVKWNKYKDWGGSNYILGVSFNEFWEDRGRKLFATKERVGTPKFNLTTKQPKTESIRLSLLVYNKWDSKKSKIKIGQEVYEYEYGISKEKRERKEARYSTFNAQHLSVDTERMNPQTGELSYPSDMQIQQDVRKYYRRARKMMKSVSEGVFP
tara:strand:- start:148 stop:732 length:585 start_codon:yes stop_codon:yes gene_type:complete